MNRYSATVAAAEKTAREIARGKEVSAASKRNAVLAEWHQKRLIEWGWEGDSTCVRVGDVYFPVGLKVTDLTEEIFANIALAIQAGIHNGTG